MTNVHTTQPTSLAEWLAYLDTLHSKQIDLGLDRVAEVYQNLNIQFSATVITVAGTNGKGTTCAALEQLALYLHKRVGVFSSPHFIDYRERVRVNNQMLDERAHCAAFEKVEAARGNISLTPFEFGTLAALCLLSDSELDVAILEVGLGGRLDSVNVVEPTLAVITSIGLDHQEYLGDTREAIALEKAGILRKDGLAVIGDVDPPHTLLDEVERLNVTALWQKQDFEFVYTKESTWNWRCGEKWLNGLIERSIPRQNLSTALACATLLEWPLDNSAAQFVCRNAALPGRFQIVGNAPLVVLDVAHNPDATQYVKQKLLKLHRGNLHLVFGMLADKDMAESLAPFKGLGAFWYASPLPTPRSATTEQLLEAIDGEEKVKTFDSIQAALEKAKQDAFEDDCILVFGSFYSVAQVLPSYS
ncbi:bifunctional tetrahydrofolate synthase/dihydrofolate synthase [Alteromonas sp. a30]|uniref:bifunctional tetrahydrofolate synthase/dihydrofolate synthase n=1 Tax=Alteromonas sp. a30 TaxID=2730917 RepID=UPI00228298C7|nr:bifunctional tetrahydrofolate synthase/dihydrofolate synthase [Alteromonas sp. a30]MCY7295247.1 bifunctional tetrahydrofolate synthase/dihydrofolate synthase [Alteromonas sp. a30]